MEIDLAQMLTNLSQTFPSLIRLATAFCYLLGVGVGFRALYRLKQYGELRTMMASNTNFMIPLMLFIISVCLIFLPSTFSALTVSFFGSTDPYGLEPSGNEQWQQLTEIIILFVQFIGIIAFVRGFMILTQLAGQAQPGVMSKGLTHIIGGLLCVHIQATAAVLASTLGIN